MGTQKWRTINPSGEKRVVVTKELPGQRWLEILTDAGCRVEVSTSTAVLSVDEIKTAFGIHCDGAIGQLTEDWGDELFAALKIAGGKAYSNYAVGFNNVDVSAATRHGIPVGNTPGVLTEATAEMAVTLTFAAARRVGEAERFLRAGKFKSWLPTLFLGEMLWGKTLGIIGAGRIGSAYARMMVQGHKMNLIYFDLQQNQALEDYVDDYAAFLQKQGLPPVKFTRASQIEELLETAEIISIHTVLDDSTHHLINAERLALMKKNAVLINTSRGPVIDETALVAHCREHPNFRAGLDVFENEPELKPGLADLENVVIVPHIASATSFAREGMATLAASNVAAMLMDYPVWHETDILPFLTISPPKAAPSILNAAALRLSNFRK
jgi:hydroxypyruvate reductase 1